MPKPITSFSDMMNAPADQDVRAAQDISGIPLPELREQPDIAATGRIINDEDNENQPDAQESEQSRPPRKVGIQARIDKLVRRNYEKDAENTRLQGQISVLTQQIAQLQNQFQGGTPAAPRQKSGVGSDGIDDLLGPQGAIGDGSGIGAMSAADVARIVDLTVQKHLKPVVDNMSQRDAFAVRKMQHEADFASAAEDMPELAKPDSDLRRVFNELFDSLPELNQLPNKPSLVAAMARGVLADQRRAEQSTVERKRAASVMVPSPASTDVGEEGRGKVSKSTAEAIEEAKKRLRAGTADFKDYKLVRLAGRK